jgi:hypothetical protein
VMFEQTLEDIDPLYAFELQPLEGVGDEPARAEFLAPARPRRRSQPRDRRRAAGRHTRSIQPEAPAATVQTAKPGTELTSATLSTRASVRKAAHRIVIRVLIAIRVQLKNCDTRRTEAHIALERLSVLRL